MHIKEFVGENNLDYKDIQTLYVTRDSFSISQMVFFIDKNLLKGKVFPKQSIQPGLYYILENKILRQSNSLEFEHKNKNEFIVSQMPMNFTQLGNRERVVRVILSWEYIDDLRTQKVVDWIRENIVLPQ